MILDDFFFIIILKSELSKSWERFLNRGFDSSSLGCLLEFLQIDLSIVVQISFFDALRVRKHNFSVTNLRHNIVPLHLDVYVRKGKGLLTSEMVTS